MNELSTPTPESPPGKHAKTKGVGSIYQRGQTWWISYSVGGKRERESSGSENRADALRLLRDRLGRIGRHEPTGAAINRTTLADLRDISLTAYAANGSRSLTSAQGAFKRLFRYVKPHQKAASVTSDVLMRYVAYAKEMGLAPATTQQTLAFLRHAYHLGHDAGKIGVIPKFPSLKFDNVRPGFFTHADYYAVLGELPDYLRPVLTIAFACGWRVRSELLTRRVRHVDLKNGKMILEPGETKNRKPRNFIFRGLPEVEAAITALVQAALPTTPEGVTALRPDPEAWLFRHPDGTRISSLRTAWASACQRAGVEKLIHDLRRSAARNLIRSGSSEKVAMQIIGHTTPAMLWRYDITADDDLHDAAARLAAYNAQQTRALASVTVQSQNAPETGLTAEKIR